MSHQVESMMSANAVVPWHGLGEIVEGAPCAEEAIKLAGLNWTADEIPLFSKLGDGVFKEVETHKQIVRSTDGRQLGVVGSNYTPVQNKDAFKWFDPFIESGFATIETAGSLRQGKKVWVLAKLNKKPITVAKGDSINKYLLLSNGHDGATAVRVGFTPIRVVCNNTLSAAEADRGGSKLIRISHTRRVMDSLDKIQDTINAVDAKFEATAEQYKFLVSKSDIKDEDIKSYVEVLFMSGKQKTERYEMRLNKMTEDITRLFESGRGNNLKSVRGTYWALYNGVTEYLSYEAGKSADTRLHKLWFGRNFTKNSEALKIAVNMAGGR